MTVARVLGRFARRARPLSEAAGDHCALCNLGLEEEHPHLVELEQRSLICACRACALLFTDHVGSVGKGRYLRVPQRVLVDSSFAITGAEWSALLIPVRIAFLFFNSRIQAWVASYPSPAGPTEAEVPSEAWSAIQARSRLVRAIQPDVEALLALRHSDGQIDCFVVPIDVCYRLVAVVRGAWRGFDGGDEARRAIADFFDGVRARARPLAGAPDDSAMPAIPHPSEGGSR